MSVQTATRFAQPAAVNRAAQVLGLVTLVSAKTADLVTTVVLLESGQVFERQSIPAAVIDGLGTVPALLVLSVLAVAGLVAIVEAGAWYLRGTGAGYAIAAVRVLGYGPISLLWFHVAAQNAAIAPVVLA